MANDLKNAWEDEEMPFGDDRVYERCDWCGGYIYEGEWFHIIDGCPVCADCIAETRREAGA